MCAETASQGGRASCFPVLSKTGKSRKLFQCVSFYFAAIIHHALRVYPERVIFHLCTRSVEKLKTALPSIRFVIRIQLLKCIISRETVVSKQILTYNIDEKKLKIHY